MKKTIALIASAQPTEVYMKILFVFMVVAFLCSCQAQQVPQFGNAKVYTTPGSPGGVSASKYEVTPL